MKKINPCSDCGNTEPSRSYHSQSSYSRLECLECGKTTKLVAPLSVEDEWNTINPVKIEHSYIGRASCGCVLAATVDEGDKRTAEAVAEFISDGLTIERVTHDYVRANFGRNCPICNPQQQAMEV